MLGKWWVLFPVCGGLPEVLGLVGYKESRVSRFRICVGSRTSGRGVGRRVWVYGMDFVVFDA